jgi:hypothetical protein
MLGIGIWNTRAIFGACTAACHRGEQLVDGSTAMKFGRTNARESWFTTGTTGGTYTPDGTTVATFYNYYTVECPDLDKKTRSWCSAVNTATMTTQTNTLAYCAGS